MVENYWRVLKFCKGIKPFDNLLGFVCEFGGKGKEEFWEERNISENFEIFHIF